MAAIVRLSTLGEGAFSAGQVAVLRFGIGAAACLSLFAVRKGTFRPFNRWLLVTRGLLGGAAALLYFVSLSLIPAGEATLLNNTFPVFATALAFFALGERPRLGLALALGVTTVGVGLVLGSGQGLSLGWGEAAGILSAVLGAGAVTSIRALRATVNAPTIFFAFCVGGLLLSWPLAGGAWPGPDARLWALALSAGALSVGAQLLMTHALGFLTVPEAAVWHQLTPVASYAWALLLLGERVSGRGALGVGLVLAGVAWGGALGPAPPDGGAGPGRAGGRAAGPGG